MKELRARADADASFPPVLFVHMGTPAEGEAFFARRWPEARAVSDPDKVLYAAFGLARGSAGQVLGPRVWGPGLKALLRGFAPGIPVGDPMMLSGLFLVAEGRIRWSQVDAHSGEERRWSELEAHLAADPGG